MSKKSTYHHGNLRQALITAAMQLLEEEGLDKLSLRGIARLAGVSQTAPYSHFKSREALLAAVAAEGHRLFTESMAEMAAQATSPEETIIGFGVGYIEFALGNPALYRLMFQADKSLLEGDEQQNQASLLGLQMIENGIAEFSPDAGPDAAMAAWSLVHGMSELILSGRIEMPAEKNARRKTVEQILKNLF
jgi:AcrR family transcriptional regulator